MITQEYLDYAKRVIEYLLDMINKRHDEGNQEDLNFYRRLHRMSTEAEFVLKHIQHVNQAEQHFAREYAYEILNFVYFGLCKTDPKDIVHQ